MKLFATYRRCREIREGIVFYQEYVILLIPFWVDFLKNCDRYWIGASIEFRVVLITTLRPKIITELKEFSSKPEKWIMEYIKVRKEVLLNVDFHRYLRNFHRVGFQLQRFS